MDGQPRRDRDYPATQTFDEKPTTSVPLQRHQAAAQLDCALRFNGNDQTRRRPWPAAPPAVHATTSGRRERRPDQQLKRGDVQPAVADFQLSYENAYSGTLDWTLSDRRRTRTSRSATTWRRLRAATAATTTTASAARSARRTSDCSTCRPSSSSAAASPTTCRTRSPCTTTTAASTSTSTSTRVRGTGTASTRSRSACSTSASATASNRAQQFPNIALQWNSLAHHARPARRCAARTATTRSRAVYTERRHHANNFGFFLQDQWTFNNKLTLNYGVRFDTTKSRPTATRTRASSSGGATRSRRALGFAYDLQGRRQVEGVRIVGRLLRHEKLEMPRGAWGARHWITYYWTLDTLQLAVDRLRRPADERLPGHVHRADRLRATCRTTRTTTWSIRT